MKGTSEIKRAINSKRKKEKGFYKLMREINAREAPKGTTTDLGLDKPSYPTVNEP